MLGPGFVEQLVFVLIMVLLIFWALKELAADAVIVKIVRVAVIVAVVLWLVHVFFFGGPEYWPPAFSPTRRH